ncbi:MAG: hypothetical protein A2W90_01410 [Bacteroidetes bacterium GWF2_42_66]|nr:MAG: hypothetical protein A2W92_11720 [Bacteroidetes bacterium GWA2_42_15]OFY01032.1 MAG: hypothetical protein A2W89_14900 [Bacteroidetes bacterium GWE2_42_39]OFY41873.1 MAG: hypothetical protein A2W90_01410 [Bacteroidetes bacterium GWF2_42_66]HBL77950.1 hypothetical protein [Prolixibacteraceae bacterium]HCR90171.1 hypothetical protein [Prolixibacteraceae bacterium]
MSVLLMNMYHHLQTIGCIVHSGQYKRCKNKQFGGISLKTEKNNSNYKCQQFSVLNKYPTNH